MKRPDRFCRPKPKKGQRKSSKILTFDKLKPAAARLLLLSFNRGLAALLVDGGG